MSEIQNISEASLLDNIFEGRNKSYGAYELRTNSSKRTVSVQKTARSDSMKRKNICAEAALREVARKNHTTVEEVRKEIRLAMIAAMCNPDPAIQKRWNAIPHAGDTLTPEDFITYVASQCR